MPLSAAGRPDRPLADLLCAVRLLLGLRVNVPDEGQAAFDGLVHPVHQRGQVIAWEVAALPEHPSD